MNKFPLPKFKTGNNKNYKLEIIKKSAIYAKNISKHLLGLYYLVA